MAWPSTEKLEKEGRPIQYNSAIWKAYGLDLVGMSPACGLHYFAAMIHFAKLRAALLTEYGV
jgi:hypothetical protein